MLSWTKNTLTKRRSFSTRTQLGTALIVEQDDGTFSVDLWRHDMTDIGKGVFPTIEAAMTRVESVLDPRATAWDLLDSPLLDDSPSKSR